MRRQNMSAGRKAAVDAAYKGAYDKAIAEGKGKFAANAASLAAVDKVNRSSDTRTGNPATSVTTTAHRGEPLRHDVGSADQNQFMTKGYNPPAQSPAMRASAESDRLQREFGISRTHANVIQQPSATAIPAIRSAYESMKQEAEMLRVHSDDASGAERASMLKKATALENRATDLKGAAYDAGHGDISQVASSSHAANGTPGPGGARTLSGSEHPAGMSRSEYVNKRSGEILKNMSASQKRQLGKAAAKAHAEGSARSEWDESQHPRDDQGKFTNA